MTSAQIRLNHMELTFPVGTLTDAFCKEVECMERAGAALPVA